MLENPAPAAQPDSTTIVKRYPPPNQRNRSISRRKSDRLDRSNSLYASDTEKNQQYASPRNLPIIDHVDLGSSNVLKENSRPGLIALDGCCHSEASQLLNNRWALAMHNYNDVSIDLSGKANLGRCMCGYFYQDGGCGLCGYAG
ncbi:uncharacterized protein LOC110627292 isoform X3 [Manihot esculenta]|uniref:Uncharacterized protein n=1 Tax=Manihot esculenta TaxID=3983 RepID=A0ACB7GQ53_MANES|nr:uncharacterized protein LOC110627292 isoform X3 [Manihot esculenta]KAG8642091.1 hypothetical protein MANES_12G055803v8 [Manihot esculenta]